MSLNRPTDPPAWVKLLAQSLDVPAPMVITVATIPITTIWADGIIDPWDVASAVLRSEATWLPVHAQVAEKVNILVTFQDKTLARFSVQICHANRTGFDLLAAYLETLGHPPI